MKPVYLLTGILVCDRCEAAFQADKHGKKKITYYRCASRRRRGKFACDNKSHLEATAIEKQVLDQVMADLLEPAFFKEWMGEVNRKHWEEKKGAARRGEQLHQRLDEVENQLEALVNAIAQQTMPLEVIEPQVNELHQEKKRLEAELRSLRLDEPPVKIISDGDFQECADLLRESLQDTETCRNILKTLVKKIRVQSTGDCTLEYLVSAVCAILNSARANRTESRFHSWLYFLAWASVCTAAKRRVSCKGIKQTQGNWVGP